VTQSGEPSRKRPPAKRRDRAAAGPDHPLVQRIIAELHNGERQTSSREKPIREGATNKSLHQILLDRLARGESLKRIDHDLRNIPGLSDEERAALRLIARGVKQSRTSTPAPPSNEPAADHQSEHPVRRKAIAAVLELARNETMMDVAMLGHIHNGHEIARQLAGDAQSFGLKPGGSIPIDDTYCQRLLQGRIPNIVRDTRANEHVRDLALTQTANIGAYIGVPLTTLDAQLYILCCLAHEQRPSLSRRDVVFLSALGETIAAELGASPVA
jgi:GAF domain-containing protein